MGKKIFVSFAIEDQFARNNLTHQAQQNHTPFNYVDMSVYDAWDSAWKTKCRARIKGCDGFIGFISDHTKDADGALWEIKCAYEEGVPVRLIYIHDHGVKALPSVINNKTIYHWTWPNIANFINSL